MSKPRKRPDWSPVGPRKMPEITPEGADFAGVQKPASGIRTPEAAPPTPAPGDQKPASSATVPGKVGYVHRAGGKAVRKLVLAVSPERGTRLDEWCFRNGRKRIQDVLGPILDAAIDALPES